MAGRTAHSTVASAHDEEIRLGGCGARDFFGDTRWAYEVDGNLVARLEKESLHVSGKVFNREPQGAASTAVDDGMNAHCFLSRALNRDASRNTNNPYEVSGTAISIKL
jgi:hypothetical protein